MTIDVVKLEHSPVRLPLRRPVAGRKVGGVCVGLAAHLDVPVNTVRIAAIVLSFAGGLGAIFYLWLWLTVPEGDPASDALAARPAALGRLMPALRRQDDEELRARQASAGEFGPDAGTEKHRSGNWLNDIPFTDIAVGIILLIVAALLIGVRFGVDINVQWVWPILLTVGGLGLAWGQLDSVRRRRLLSKAGGRTPSSVVRLLGGLALVLVGVLMTVGRGQDLENIGRAAIAGAAMLLGVSLVLAPWLLGLIRDLGAERAARARESERADIAAHLHDSVLQTLALIRKRADNADAVRMLARAQERELRTWLYGDRPESGDSIAEAIREIAAEVEDTHGVPIDVVVVGDAKPNESMIAVLMASREALRNAVNHGKPPVSLYLEVGSEDVEVFIRDRGEGFDPENVPEDRLGVRESVIGRVTRHGGEASVRSKAQGASGTEIRLRMPWDDAGSREETPQTAGNSSETT